MRTLVGVLIMLPLCAQDPELGRIEISSGQGILTVDSPRPLDSVAKTLAHKYGIIINAEDPVYLYSADMQDVTATVVRTMRPGLRVFVPKGGPLEVRFVINPDGSPQDMRALLSTAIEAANARYPFAFRLDQQPDSYTFIPTATRDAQGRAVSAPALLDRKVTIPLATRSLIEHANLMAEALSAQTGFRVSCCQGAIAGIPWGLEKVSFEARDEPARSVLNRIMHSAPGRYHYLQRCDPVTPGRTVWCFINLEGLR